MGNPAEKPNIARTSVVTDLTALKLPYIDKPTGYSLFPGEMVPVPKRWAAMTCNLVSFNEHKSGGHFAVGESVN